MRLHGTRAPSLFGSSIRSWLKGRKAGLRVLQAGGGTASGASLSSHTFRGLPQAKLPQVPAGPGLPTTFCAAPGPSRACAQTPFRAGSVSWPGAEPAGLTSDVTRHLREWSPRFDTCAEPPNRHPGGGVFPVRTPHHSGWRPPVACGFLRGSPPHTLRSRSELHFHCCL